MTEGSSTPKKSRQGGMAQFARRAEKILALCGAEVKKLESGEWEIRCGEQPAAYMDPQTGLLTVSGKETGKFAMGLQAVAVLREFYPDYARPLIPVDARKTIGWLNFLFREHWSNRRVLQRLQRDTGSVEDGVLQLLRQEDWEEIVQLANQCGEESLPYTVLDCSNALKDCRESGVSAETLLEAMQDPKGSYQPEVRRARDAGRSLPLAVTAELLRQVYSLDPAETVPLLTPAFRYNEALAEVAAGLVGGKVSRKQLKAYARRVSEIADQYPKPWQDIETQREEAPVKRIPTEKYLGQ